MFSLLLSSFLAALTITSVTALPTISVKGSKFFTSDGDQFFIKGLAYQLSEDDPLIDTNQCQMDAKLMKELGANTIRVYHVKQGDHSGCMRAFNDAGIYLFVDLDTFTTGIKQESPHWNRSQEQAFEAVMDEFHSFDNTAGFFIGNEVIQDGQHSQAAVYVKAATRDLKAYRGQKGYRDIPIGYAHADISSLRPNLQNYLTCGPNADDSIDFFGLNVYEWCGQSSFSVSGYSTLTDQVENFPVPVFLSETGCNNPEPRTFDDQNAVFGPQMDQYWSGAIIYEWIQEVNDFGLVSYGGHTDALQSIAPTAQIQRSGSPTPVTPDFSKLKSTWAAVSPSSVSSAAYSPNVTPPPCPAFTPGVWELQGDVSLPQVGATFSGRASNTGGGPAAAGPTSSKAAAPVGKEVAGMGVGLAGVGAGFMWFL